MEAHYDIDKNITYWVIRGYNKLPKRGALSVHGGATFEERLVPVIVFTAKKAKQNKESIDKKSTVQLVERGGFDDI